MIIVEVKEEKTNYSNRRKTFHFSKKNDDLLQYLNKKDTKEQSAFIMRLIREEMEREQFGDPLLKLQDQLDKALDEINQLREELTKRPVSDVQTQGNTLDDEVVNRLFMMLADAKRENANNFEELKAKLSNIQVIDAVHIETSQQTNTDEELSNDEYDELFDDDFDLN